jgi:hypothetical protein
LTFPATVSEILIRPAASFASMSAAVFTASPQISKVNFRRPTTPDMTGPVWIPTRNSSAGSRMPFGDLYDRRDEKAAPGGIFP